ncbi:hypothetical protein C8Q80DRAFT_1192191 [Daedaleopsis nitida]|nr:hypothetical protein C8Q80DRAFT_1192191 [Daedaleopsis nitida]
MSVSTTGGDGGSADNARSALERAMQAGATGAHKLRGCRLSFARGATEGGARVHAGVGVGVEAGIDVVESPTTPWGAGVRGTVVLGRLRPTFSTTGSLIDLLLAAISADTDEEHGDTDGYALTTSSAYDSDSSGAESSLSPTRFSGSSGVASRARSRCDSWGSECTDRENESVLSDLLDSYFHDNTREDGACDGKYACASSSSKPWHHSESRGGRCFWPGNCKIRTTTHGSSVSGAAIR